MEVIRINKNTNQPSTKEAYEVTSMKIVDGGLYIKFVTKDEMIFHVDDVLVFDKILNVQGDEPCMASKRVKIKQVLSINEVIVEKIDADDYQINYDRDVIVIRNGNYAFFGITLINRHGFYPQDLLKIHNEQNQSPKVSPLTLYVKSVIDGEVTHTFDEVCLCRKHGSDLIYFGSDAFIEMVGGNTCNLNNFDYDVIFFKESVNLETNINEILQNSVISFNYNNFYLNDSDGNCKLFAINTKENVRVRKEASNFTIPISISTDDNYKTLMNELLSTDKYYQSVVNGIVPDFIDMEKLRYEPVYVDERNVVHDVREIEYVFHFRTRKMNGSELDKSWYIKDLTSFNEEVWNGMKFSDLSNYDDYRSDLLWYLGFNDTDVFYQKNRLAKSFVRLSYYTTDNPLNQKLMAYSTIFVDTNDLYGKYMKLINTSDGADYKKAGGELVKYETSGTTDVRLSSKLSVENEFNNEKSSDGFYCYLFASDAQENSGKTIYMKVEFNHAGYGRTLPMHQWLFTGTEKSKVNENITNYFDFLYIKVQLDYINNRYVYKFNKSYYDQYSDTTINFDEKTGKLQIVLFEPFFTHKSNSNQ